MHKPKRVLENKIDKILWNFEIKTDQPIPGGRPNIVLIAERKESAKSDHRYNLILYQEEQKCCQ